MAEPLNATFFALRHRDRAFFFKIAVNENFARLSPGVQLTLELTKQLCADDGVTLADSTAAPGHPMMQQRLLQWRALSGQDRQCP